MATEPVLGAVVTEVVTSLLRRWTTELLGVSKFCLAKVVCMAAI
jgi:hypothetical protein